MTHSIEKDQRFAELMRSAQHGGQSSYAQLLGEVTPLLRRFVQYRRNFLQSADIEDLVQDILLSLHAARATYDPRRPFLAWLLTIARNRMADGARRYARRLAEVAVDELPETFSDEGTNMPEDVYGDPEALGRAMQRLPTGQREAVEMLKLREMSLREAAAATGLNIGALKVAVHRGMKSLRRALEASS